VCVVEEFRVGGGVGRGVRAAQKSVGRLKKNWDARESMGMKALASASMPIFTEKNHAITPENWARSIRLYPKEGEGPCLGGPDNEPCSPDTRKNPRNEQKSPNKEKPNPVSSATHQR